MGPIEYRDAWKKLEGMERLEAKHRYTETLLRSATEVMMMSVGERHDR